MESVVGAIIVGAIIIAFSISSLKSGDNNDNDYYPPSTFNHKLFAIEDGIKSGSNEEEIYENNKSHFNSIEDVNKYIDQYNLREEFDEVSKLRKENPNFVQEREIENGQVEMEEIRENIKNYEEDLALAKETHQYDQAKTDIDLIKYEKRRLEGCEIRIKELRTALKGTKKTVV